MFQSRFLRCTIVTTLFVLRLFGVWPYFYDPALRRYRTKWFLLVYPLVVWALLLHLFIHSADTLFERIRLEMRTDTARLIYASYSTMCVLTFSSNYFLQYLWFSSIEAALVEAADVVGRIRSLRVDRPWRYWRPLCLYCAKAWLLPAIICLCDAVRVWSLSPSNRPAQIMLFELSVFLMGVVPNLHVALLLTVGVLFKRLNEETATVMRLAQKLAQPQASPSDEHCDHFRRMHLFCELSDRLDRVAVLHLQLTEITMRLQQMFSLTLIVWVCFQCMDVVTHAFSAYVFLCEWMMVWQMADKTLAISVTNIGLNLLLAFGTTLDMFLLAKVCATVAGQSQRSLVIMHERFLAIDVDVRFRRSVGD